MVITLTPDVERALTEEARQQGISPERLALDSLRERFVLRDDEGFPIQDTLADVIGFDPGDEKQSRALAESQYHALQESLARLTELGLDSALHQLPPSDSDLDAILYNEED